MSKVVSFKLYFYLVMEKGFPGSAVVKNLPDNAEDRRHEFDPSVWKNPWRRKWQPTPVFLPGKSQGQRSLVGYSAWGCKGSDTTEHACTHTMKMYPYLIQNFNTNCDSFFVPQPWLHSDTFTSIYKILGLSDPHVNNWDKEIFPIHTLRFLMILSV